MHTQYETLLVTVDGPIVEVLLNRPAKRNAINFAMVRDFNSVLAEAKYDNASGWSRSAARGRSSRRATTWRTSRASPRRASGASRIRRSTRCCPRCRCAAGTSPSR